MKDFNPAADKVSDGVPASHAPSTTHPFSSADIPQQDVGTTTGPSNTAAAASVSNVGKVFDKVPMKATTAGNNKNSSSNLGVVISFPVTHNVMSLPGIPPPKTDNLSKVHLAFVGKQKAISKNKEGIRTRGGLRRSASSSALVGEIHARVDDMAEIARTPPSTHAAAPSLYFAQAVQKPTSSLVPPPRKHLAVDQKTIPSVVQPAKHHGADLEGSSTSSPWQSPPTLDDDDDPSIPTPVLPAPGWKAANFIGKQRSKKKGFAAHPLGVKTRHGCVEL